MQPEETKTFDFQVQNLMTTEQTHAKFNVSIYDSQGRLTDTQALTAILEAKSDVATPQGTTQPQTTQSQEPTQLNSTLIVLAIIVLSAILVISLTLLLYVRDSRKTKNHFSPPPHQ